MVNRVHGFTLLELLYVMAILSILAFVGSSQFLTMSQRSQDKNILIHEMKRLADALMQARQLAVVSGQTSYLCGGLMCNGKWSAGVTLYQIERMTGSEKIVQQVTFDSSLSVVWHGFPAQKQQIEFQANGLSGFQNGTFEFCLGVWRADLILNQSGRFYLTDPQGSQGGHCG